MKLFVPEEARLAEVAYHRKQNFFVLAAGAPSILFFAWFYFYLGKYFQSALFVLWLVTIVVGILDSSRHQTVKKLALSKRIFAGIGFGLFATNLLTGLWDPDIYYIVLPWTFAYAVTAVLFYGRKQGFVLAMLFCSAAISFILINEMPPLTARNTKLFEYNTIAVLVMLLFNCLVYEKARMKVQDELAISQNQYRLAELRQRETNIELTEEIARREQFEKALAESELHYRALFEESTVALWEEDFSRVKSFLDSLPEAESHDPAAFLRQHVPDVAFLADRIQTTALNRAAMKLFKIQREDKIPMNLFSVMHPRDHEKLASQIADLVQTGSSRWDCIFQDGARRLYLSVISSIPAGYEDNWMKVYSSIYDMTQRIEMEEAKKRMDEKLQNARQIQAIATLAGGIAHQFNNALAVIYGSLDLLEIQAGQNPESRRFLVSLKTSATRMSHLTDQLLAYAEGGKYQPQEFSVNDLIQDLTGIKNAPQGTGIKIKVLLDQAAPTISGDITQIKMVLEAVLSNALEALNRTEGSVTVATGRHNVTREGSATNGMIEPGEYLLIRVEDDGSGMDQDTLNRIFEPFFTTKIHGRGLGMAAAFGIVRNHDGLITVASEPAKGTKVSIYLPASRSRQQAEYA